MILPHRKYDLLTGEFRKKDSEHQAYLGNKWEKWDADKVLAEASFLHFSDWPMPKPWIGASAKVKGEAIPKCEGGSQNCKEKVAWEGFYEDFAKRRKVSLFLINFPILGCPQETELRCTPKFTSPEVAVDLLNFANISFSRRFVQWKLLLENDLWRRSGGSSTPMLLNEPRYFTNMNL